MSASSHIVELRDSKVLHGKLPPWFLTPTKLAHHACRQPGTKYRPHVDTLDEFNGAVGGGRWGTFILYLEEPEVRHRPEGGESQKATRAPREQVYRGSQKRCTVEMHGTALCLSLARRFLILVDFRFGLFVLTGSLGAGHDSLNSRST